MEPDQPFYVETREMLRVVLYKHPYSQLHSLYRKGLVEALMAKLTLFHETSHELTFTVTVPTIKYRDEFFVERTIATRQRRFKVYKVKPLMATSGISAECLYWANDGVVKNALWRAVPGLENVRMVSPCNMQGSHRHYNGELFLTEIIIELNDKCGWTREQTADWLETLDVNLNFKVPENVS